MVATKANNIANVARNGFGNDGRRIILTVSIAVHRIFVLVRDWLHCHGKRSGAACPAPYSEALFPTHAPKRTHKMRHAPTFTEIISKIAPNTNSLPTY